MLFSSGSLRRRWRVGGGVTNTTYGDVVLRERWNVKLVDATPQQFVFDITSHQEALVPIQLPAYRYGGMAFRGAAQWLPKTAPFRVLTSEGHDRKSGDGARARWFHGEGEIDGATVGFAMLDAPTNSRSLSGGSGGSTDEWDSHAKFTTNLTIVALAEHYRRQFAEAGWVEEGPLFETGTVSITRYKVPSKVGAALPAIRRIIGTQIAPFP